MEPGRDPLSDLDVIEAELAAYGGLEDRPRLVALNKVDVPEARELAEMVRPELEARGWRVFEISAATHEGLRELTFAMAEVVVDGAGEPRGRRPATGSCCARRGESDVEFTIREARGDVWRVRGVKPRALGPADRLQQRRGGRLPRRPAEPARCRGAAARARCAGRRRRRDR